MQYNERILAFIDILGFRSTIEKTIECYDGKERENILELQRIDNLLDEIHYQLHLTHYLSKELKIKNRIVSQFSDSVVISYSKENYIHNIFHEIYFLCVMALEKGFLFRGAIVCGKVIHTEKKLFGPAFNKAYEMERYKAIFPRIILAENIFEIAKKNYKNCSNPDAEYNSLKKLISCDFDGIHYVNYIDKLYTGVDVGNKGKNEHRLWLEENIKKLKKASEEDSHIGCKYLWLKEKYEKRINHPMIGAT